MDLEASGLMNTEVKVKFTVNTLETLKRDIKQV